MNTERFEELTRLFRLAGAPDPESWASSEVEENFPQLARFLFLRQAWRGVIAEDDQSWIDAYVDLARRDPNSPGASGGKALERLLEVGANRADLAQVVRVMQWELLFYLCYMLEDPRIDEPELQHISWRLNEVNANHTVGRPMYGLHESVLHTDPTGREMRPKNPDA